MKKLIYATILINCYFSHPLQANTPIPKAPQSQQQSTTNTDDENFNSHVALAGVANMVNGFSHIITDKEGSPGTLISSAAQIFVGLANLVVELCKNLPLDQEVRCEHIEYQLTQLSTEQKFHLIALLKAYQQITLGTRFTSCPAHTQPADLP